VAARGTREERSEQSKQRRIGVDVVERGTVVDLRIVVKDVGIQSRVHALPRTTCREASTTAEENLDGSKGIDVLIVDTRTFEGEVEIVELERWVVNEPVTTDVIYRRAGIDIRPWNFGLGLYAGVVEVRCRTSHRLVK